MTPTPAANPPTPATAATSCPTPTKRAFDTERDARVRLTEILADPRTIALPHRAHLCECGFWHLTSSPARAIVRPTPTIVAHAVAELRMRRVS